MACRDPFGYGTIMAEVARQMGLGRHPTVALIGRAERQAMSAPYGPAPSSAEELTADEEAELRKAGMRAGDGQHRVHVFFVPDETRLEVF